MLRYLAVALLASSMTLVVRPAHAQAGIRFAVRAVRVFDGERTLEDRTVVVRDGRIARVGGADTRIPSGFQIVDGRGRTLLPGLLDAHVHLSEDLEADLGQAASLGVTTLLDMWSGSARLARIRAIAAADPPGMADVRTAGNGATAPGGHPSQMGGPAMPTIDDSAAAHAFVAARFAEGADYLKIIYDDVAGFGRPLPMLSRGTLVALIAAAHERRRMAVVHIGSERQAREAIGAEADGLVHWFVADSVAPDLAPLVARHRAFVVPTLGVLRAAFCGQRDGATVARDSLLRPWIRPLWRQMMMAPGRGGPARSCAATEVSIRALAGEGVDILVGTDAPVPGQTYGASVHVELALLVGAGLTPIQALTAATSAPASRFGLEDRGFVRVGLRADLLLVDGDPTRNIAATRRIVAVWKRGVAVARKLYPEQ